MIIAEGRLVLRWWNEACLPDLVELHRRCFPREGWTAEDFVRFAARPGNHLKVLTVDEESESEPEVLGSLLFSLDPGTCRVRRVAVRQDHRRRGLGAFLINRLVRPRGPIDRRRFEARVRERNLPAQLLLRKFDFYCHQGTVGVDPWGENLYLFTLLKEPRLVRHV
jgi:ribosomal-protein-alanine N-acetyltransferase